MSAQTHQCLHIGKLRFWELTLPFGSLSGFSHSKTSEFFIFSALSNPNASVWLSIHTVSNLAPPTHQTAQSLSSSVHASLHLCSPSPISRQLSQFKDQAFSQTHCSLHTQLSNSALILVFSYTRHQCIMQCSFLIIFDVSVYFPQLFWKHKQLNHEEVSVKFKNKVFAVPFPGLDAEWVRMLEGRRRLQSVLVSGKEINSNFLS